MNAASNLSIPYCGFPPLPNQLWFRWNFDPLLALLLVLVPAILVVRSEAKEGPGFCFHFGWVLTTAALVSPLCALSVSLLSARISQHMILLLAAAPLVACGAAGRRAGASARASKAAAVPLPAAALFALLLWFWHAPAPYDTTFASTFAYWTMHATLFGSAVWLWRGLLVAPVTAALPVAAAALFSSVQMALLGAILTFAPRPLFAAHLLTTAAWGLTPLQDQQLGGAIMWVPGCVAFLGVGIYSLWRVVDGEASARRLERSLR